MRHLLRTVLLATALTPSVALADHPFILPSSTLLAGSNNTVTFDAASSEHVFFFDHRPLQLAAIKVVKPDTTEATLTNPLQTRFRSVFDVRMDQEGTWKAVSDQSIVIGSFKQNGEERRVGGRGGPPPGGAPGGPGAAFGPSGAVPGGPGGPGGEGGIRRQPPVALADIPAEATDVHLVEIVNHVETFVTAGAPTTTALKPTGKGLELDPITHPNAIAAGETARFRLLIDGKPAGGLAVTVIAGGDRYREETAALASKTGADGIVAIRWPGAGMYWVGVEAEDAHPTEKRAEKRRMNYAGTFEVMTP